MKSLHSTGVFFYVNKYVKRHDSVFPHTHFDSDLDGRWMNYLKKMMEMIVIFLMHTIKGNLFIVVLSGLFLNLFPGLCLLHQT